MFNPVISDCFEFDSLGNDAGNNLYRIFNLSRDNQNRLSHDSSVVWASEVQQHKRYIQSDLELFKPTLLISYNDVSRWIDQKINAFRSVVSNMINSVVNGAKNTLNATINAVRSTASNAYNKANEAIGKISSGISSAVSQAKSYADNAVRVAKSGLDYAISTVRGTAQNAYNKAVEVANSVSSKVSSAIGTAKSYADSVVSSAKSALNSAINTVKSTAQNAYNKAVEVGNSISSKVSSAISTAKSYADGLVKKYDNFISGINTTINNVVQPLLKPFNDFAKGINKTVMDIVNPVVKPLQDAFNGLTNTVNKAVEIAVKPFKAAVDKVKEISSKIANLPQEILKKALEQAKDHFKGILDNFKSGIDTIKGTINGILSSINKLNNFKTETNNRLTNLENSINNFSRLFVTQTSFNTFKSDVDNRIRLLNVAVSSINTDLKAAFQEFNLSLTDGFRRTVQAIYDTNPFNAINNLHSFLVDRFIAFDENLDRLLSTYFIGLFSKLDEKLTYIYNQFHFYLAMIADDVRAILGKQEEILNSIKAINSDGWLDKIEKILDTISSKFDDLIKTVKEIELPKEENNTTVNKEAETNFWDVVKEALMTLKEFIKNPAKLVELLIGFIKDLIVPHDINFFSDFRTEVSTKFDKKLPFVGQFKNSILSAFSKPKTFQDYTLSYNFIKFSGTITVPFHFLNDLGGYSKAYITGFFVFGFLLNMYTWFINRGAKLNDD